MQHAAHSYSCAGIICDLLPPWAYVESIDLERGKLSFTWAAGFYLERDRLSVCHSQRRGERGKAFLFKLARFLQNTNHAFELPLLWRVAIA